SLPAGGAARGGDWSGPGRRSIPARESRRRADAGSARCGHGGRERRRAAAAARLVGGQANGRRCRVGILRAARGARGAEQPRLKITREFALDGTAPAARQLTTRTHSEYCEKFALSRPSTSCRAAIQLG